MSDDDYRKKVCYRYRECNMICVMNKGDFVFDSDVKNFRTIHKVPTKI